MKASKHRTLKKVFLNIVAILCVLMIAGNIIADANAKELHNALGTQSFRIEKLEGAGEASDEPYFPTKYDSVKALKEAGEQLVRKVEGEGIVLLKNEGNVLPLAAGSNVALYGATVINPVYGGTGSGAVDASGAPDYIDVFEGADYNIVNKMLMDAYVEGEVTRTNSEIGEKKWSWVSKRCRNEDGDDVIGQGEHAFFVVGRVGGEGNDLTSTGVEDTYDDSGDYLTLNDNERDILESLAEMKADGEIASITVIINSANPISVAFLNDPAFGVDAALWVGSVGQTGLWAVGDVISGATNPSGSLPDTWWNDNQLNPVQNNFGAYLYDGNKGMGTWFDRYVVYQEGIYLGYKYTETRYEDVVLGTPKAGNFNWSEVVGYPFGYGLSYTTFQMSDLKVEKTTRTTEEVIMLTSEVDAAKAQTREENVYTVQVTVTNTGDKAGKKTVQVYAQKPYTEYDKQYQIEKASAELVGYGKTDVLEPGASQTITVTVPEYFLTSYDALNTGVYMLAGGTHYLTVADNSHEAVNNILTKKGKTVADGMTRDGDTNLVYAFEQEQDTETYAKSYGTGAEVKSLFADADVNRYEGRGDNSVVYYSRSDWEGTVTPGTVKLSMTDKMAADVKLDDNDLPTFTEADKWPVMGQNAGLQLIHLKEEAIDSLKWDEYMDQLSFEDLALICANGLRMTYGLPNLGKPETLDHNGPSGVTQKYSTGSNGYANTKNDPDKEQKGTCFPCNGIVAATFNDALVLEVGEMIGEDCMWAGYAGLYGSGLNIHRSPYSGRVFEYYSEDGILTGLIDAAETLGIQSKGVYVYNKHFVLNDQEDNRAGIGTWCNEQALREIYLRAFELPIVYADAKSVMTAYNRLGAKWAGAYPELLVDWLRGEAGMSGFAVTDMYDPNYMVKVHEVVAGNDIPDDYAGTDLSEFTDYGPDGKKANPIVAQRMRESAKRVLYTVLHSRAMEGIDANTKVVSVTAWWQAALQIGQWASIALTVIAAALLLADLGKEKFGKRA